MCWICYFIKILFLVVGIGFHTTQINNFDKCTVFISGEDTCDSFPHQQAAVNAPLSQR